ncbi:MAG: hypothetical protein KAS32_22970 [Candidatus Peribacteraceae bacterium]|nr:hypothetical protein [Candidatus Peribacteraceae bacterium]
MKFECNSISQLSKGKGFIYNFKDPNRPVCILSLAKPTSDVYKVGSIYTIELKEEISEG